MAKKGKTEITNKRAVTQVEDLHLTPERRQVFDQLAADSQRVVLALASRVRSSALRAAKDGYDIGALANQVTATPRTYGDNALADIAFVLNLHGTNDRKQELLYLQEMANVAHVYSEEYFTELVERGLNQGYRFSVSIVTALARITNAKTRASMEEACVKRNYSVRDLQHALSGKQAKGSSGGRPVSAPKTADAAISQILESLGQLRKRIPVWDEKLFNVVMSDPEKEVTPEMEDRLRSLRETLRATDDALDGRIDLLDKLLTRLERSHEGNGQKAADSKKPVAAAKPAANKTTKKKKKKPAAAAAG